MLLLDALLLECGSGSGDQLLTRLVAGGDAMREPTAHGSSPRWNGDVMLPSEKVQNIWGYYSLLAVVGIVLLPPWILIRYSRVSPRWLLAGGGIWAATVVAKGLLASILARAVRKWLPIHVSAVLEGLLSALVELGGAALYFQSRPRGRLTDGFAFGVGAGCTEALFVLLWAVTGVGGGDADKQATWAARAAVSLCVRYALPIERFSALLGHAGSRGLVYLSVSVPPFQGVPLFILALLLFAVVDGVASYGLTAGWDWLDPRVCSRFYGAVSGIGLLEVVLFLLFSRMLFH